MRQEKQDTKKLSIQKLEQREAPGFIWVNPGPG